MTYNIFRARQLCFYDKFRTTKELCVTDADVVVTEDPSLAGDRESVLLQGPCGYVQEVVLCCRDDLANSCLFGSGVCTRQADGLEGALLVDEEDSREYPGGDPDSAHRRDQGRGYSGCDTDRGVLHRQGITRGFMMMFRVLFMMIGIPITAWFLIFMAMIFFVSCIWEKGRKARATAAMSCLFVAMVLLLVLNLPYNWTAIHNFP
jgi:hypothetical protein